MDIEQILALIAALEPQALALIQAIVTAINGSNSTVMNDKAVPTITAPQKAMLTSLMAMRRDSHAMLCDMMSKHYGITV